MSRKHYQATADVIKTALANEYHKAPIERVARGLADVFAADNARFDRQRFFKACGL